MSATSLLGEEFPEKVRTGSGLMRTGGWMEGGADWNCSGDSSEILLAASASPGMLGGSGSCERGEDIPPGVVRVGGELGHGSSVSLGLVLIRELERSGNTGSAGRET